MSPATIGGARARAAGAATCLMIALSLAAGLSGGAFPAWPAGLVAWLIGIALLPTISSFQRVQTGLMAGVGVAALAVAIAGGAGGVLGPLVVGNQALLAMLATVSFLRMVTRTGDDPDERLPRGRRALWQTLLATHLFGAVINISAAFIVGQRIARDGSLTPLQAKVVSRAFTAAACWSPLFAAMAVVLHYVPGVDMFHVTRVNLVLAVLLLGWSAQSLARDAAVDDFVGFPLHREALTVPLLLAALVVGLYLLPTGWPILSTIIVAALGCVALLRMGRPPGETRRLLLHHVERELPRMGGEFALFLGASVLAGGIAALASVGHLDLVIDPHQPREGIPLLFTLVALTLVGIHPVISVATLSGLFPTTLAAPDLVGIVVLMAWSVALGTSPFSGTALALQGRFGIPATRFLRWNLAYLAIGLVLASAVLLAADYFAWA
ncbi:MAG: hypothetical protein H6977_15365 [Gammaproteobacteria bacterium]|nr:hypothetical protein [Gammaproteobacteria bacterium]MCP5201380.1 hypothetical protein [Gammaproteobacteria bacterium]